MIHACVFLSSRPLRECAFDVVDSIIVCIGQTLCDESARRLAMAAYAAKHSPRGMDGYF